MDRPARLAVGLQESIPAAAQTARAAETVVRAATQTGTPDIGATANVDCADNRIRPGNPAETIPTRLATAAAAVRSGLKVETDIDRASGEDRGRSASAKADPARPASIAAAYPVGL